MPDNLKLLSHPHLDHTSGQAWAAISNGKCCLLTDNRAKASTSSGSQSARLGREESKVSSLLGVLLNGDMSVTRFKLERDMKDQHT